MSAKKSGELRLNGTTERFLKKFDKLTDDVSDLKTQVSSHISQSDEIVKSHRDKIRALHYRINGFNGWFKILTAGVFSLVIAVIGLIATIAAAFI